MTRRGLLQFDSTTSSFDLSLQLVGFFLVDAFLDGLWSRLNERLRFGQAKTCDRADFLDDVDLLATVAGQDHVEFGLLFNSRTGSRSWTSGSRRSSSRNAPLLFKQLRKFSSFANGQSRQVVDDFVQISHVIFLRRFNLVKQTQRLTRLPSRHMPKGRGRAARPVPARSERSASRVPG